MSKSSTVTVRERPVEDVARVQAGGLTIHGETILVQTEQRIELVDLTKQVMEFVRKFNVREGLVSLWSMHTTCALFINEFQTALLTDIRRFLEQMVARDAEWMHNDPEHSDCDRMNADAHLRAMLLGHTLTLQVSGGEVVLGQWQRLLMAELDGPRARSLRIQLFGITRHRRDAAPAAARFSRRCASDEVPGISRMLRERCSSQASASCIGVTSSDAAAASSADDCSGLKPPSGKNGTYAIPRAARSSMKPSSFLWATL